MSATEPAGRPLVDVRVEALSTRGGRPPGVHEVGVHVRYGEFFTFLGPPKSGKSDVLLRSRATGARRDGGRTQDGDGRPPARPRRV